MQDNARRRCEVPAMAGMVMTPEMLASDPVAPSLTKLKQDLGMPDKDLTIIPVEGKVRTSTSWCVLTLTHIDATRATVPSKPDEAAGVWR